MSHVVLDWLAEPAADSLASLIRHQMAHHRPWEVPPALRKPARATAWKAVAEGLLKMTADMALRDAPGTQLSALTVTPTTSERQPEPA